MRLLLIDDDVKLAGLLKDYLATFQMELTSAVDAESGWHALLRDKPELVILDIMMPGTDGFELCRRIRAAATVPIIMLSARGETVDRIVGLELGADDFLAKPFDPRELVSRIQSVLRRTTWVPASDKLEFPGLLISAAAREAYFDNGSPVGLSSMEFELLLLLAKTPGKKFSRDEIMAHLQGVQADVYSRSVDILVSRVRAKLHDDAKVPRYIKAARGWGYVFLGGAA